MWHLTVPTKLFLPLRGFGTVKFPFGAASPALILCFPNIGVFLTVPRCTQVTRGDWHRVLFAPFTHVRGSDLQVFGPLAMSQILPIVGVRYHWNPRTRNQ